MELSDLKKISSYSEQERISEFTVGRCLTNLKYYNREFLDECIRVLLSNYVDGALGVVKIFEMYVCVNDLATVKIRKGKR